MTPNWAWITLSLFSPSRTFPCSSRSCLPVCKIGTWTVPCHIVKKTKKNIDFLSLNSLPSFAPFSDETHALHFGPCFWTCGPGLWAESLMQQSSDHICLSSLSLHLECTSQPHHLKEYRPQVKTFIMIQKGFQRHCGPRGVPRGIAQGVTGPWQEVSVWTQVSCEPGALHPSLATNAFCPLVLSKVRPLWKILALLIILEGSSRHICRRDAVSFVCTVHPGKRVSLLKSNLALSQVFFP